MSEVHRNHNIVIAPGSLTLKIAEIEEEVSTLYGVPMSVGRRGYEIPEYVEDPIERFETTQAFGVIRDLANNFADSNKIPVTTLGLDSLAAATGQVDTPDELLFVARRGAMSLEELEQSRMQIFDGVNEALTRIKSSYKLG